MFEGNKKPQERWRCPRLRLAGRPAVPKARQIRHLASVIDIKGWRRSVEMIIRVVYVSERTAGDAEKYRGKKGRKE